MTLSISKDVSIRYGMVNGSAAYQHRDTIMEIEVDFYRLVLVFITSCQLPVPARSNRLQFDHCRLQWDHCPSNKNQFFTLFQGMEAYVCE